MKIDFGPGPDILRVEPTGPLGRADFEQLASVIEGRQQSGQKLRGIMISTRDFPGYEEASALVDHFRFVSEYGDAVQRVAVCTDSVAGPVLEAIGRVFGDATVKRFDFDEQPAAERWLAA